MCRSMILVGAVLVIAILFPLRLWGEGDGVIEGRVVNATAGDAPLQSAQVTLRTWSGEAELDPRTATTDETGHYRFDNLNPVGHTYQLRVEHQAIAYGFGEKVFPAGESLLSIPLTVYDATSDDGALVVERMHLIIDREQDLLYVQEVHIFGNESTSTYVGSPGEDERGTIRFLLPPEAANVEWMSGFPQGSVVISDEGFDFVLPVLPGSAEFSFGYILPFSAPPYAFERITPYSVRSMDVFAAVGEVTLTSAQMTTSQPVSMPGGDYHHLEAAELPTGTVFAFQVDPVEPSHDALAPSEGTSQLATIAIIGGIALLAVLILAYPFLRRRRGGQKE